MKASLQAKPISHDSKRLVRVDNCHSGQALLEFSFVLVTIVILLMGMVDFGRIFTTRQVLTSVTREGANLASRSLTLSNTVSVMISSAQPLDIPHKGYVIVSTIARSSNGVVSITAQQASGGSVFSSRIGSMGASGASVSLPNRTIPATNSTIQAAEIFYRFTPATPVGNLLGRALPTALYDVAYF